MRRLDEILSKVGLVRKQRHEAIIESHVAFCRLLAAAAKEKGVKVVLDDVTLFGVELDSDVFVLGSRNALYECMFKGGRIILSPAAQNNYFVSAEANHDHKPDDQHPA